MSGATPNTAGSLSLRAIVRLYPNPRIHTAKWDFARSLRPSRSNASPLVCGDLTFVCPLRTHAVFEPMSIMCMACERDPLSPAEVGVRTLAVAPSLCSVSPLVYVPSNSGTVADAPPQASPGTTDSCPSIAPATAGRAVSITLWRDSALAHDHRWSSANSTTVTTFIHMIDSSRGGWHQRHMSKSDPLCLVDIDGFRFETSFVHRPSWCLAVILPASRVLDSVVSCSGSLSGSWGSPSAVSSTLAACAAAGHLPVFLVWMIILIIRRCVGWSSLFICSVIVNVPEA